MSRVSRNIYAHWRLHHGFAAQLRDGAAAPPERLLQAIWQQQRLQRDRLRTLDGEPVRVLHPGFASVGSGPDFRGAVVQFGSPPPLSCDVEVDLRPDGWRAHGHDRNAAFKGVRLHVVWEAERAAGFPGATLALKPFLDAPVGELSLWLEHEPLRQLPESLRGKCSAPLRGVDEAALSELLQQAARVRLEAKAALFQARARQAGWEQSLWEGLFRAAGYQHNMGILQNV